MKLSEAYKNILKDLHDACENLKNYSLRTTVLDYTKLRQLSEAYEAANKAYENFDKNLYFED